MTNALAYCSRVFNSVHVLFSEPALEAKLQENNFFLGILEIFEK
jgi:hypothetical protein